jgi:hypothetical protein
MTFGQDNDGNRWTTSRWQGIDTTTVTPPPDPRLAASGALWAAFDGFRVGFPSQAFKAGF